MARTRFQLLSLSFLVDAAGTMTTILQVRRVGRPASAVVPDTVLVRRVGTQGVK